LKFARKTKESDLGGKMGRYLSQTKCPAISQKSNFGIDRLTCHPNTHF
jgi:hypothetical protein